MSHPVSIFPDQFRLDGRTALITGSGRGLGWEIAQALAQAGARVLLHGLMFAAAAAAIVVALALVITRAIKGPTVFDRVLAGNSVGSLAIMLLAVVGFLTGRPEFLDVGLTYGLLNLIGTLAVLKFFRHGDLAYDPRDGTGP